MLLPSARNRTIKTCTPPLCMLTCYDYPSARILEQAGIDILLVGDSVGTNVLGYHTISQVTMNDMLHHTGAVARGAGACFVLADMPSGSFPTCESALENAGRLVEAGADGVKMEGESEALEQVRRVAGSGIPVCAHIGYTPQTDGEQARVQGKHFDRAVELVEIARSMEQAGATLLVLELVPRQLAAMITAQLTIPTIGIGAGGGCSGQVQVLHDIAGVTERTFRHAGSWGDLRSQLHAAATAYCREVREATFPAPHNSVELDAALEQRIREWFTAAAPLRESP